MKQTFDYRTCLYFSFFQPRHQFSALYWRNEVETSLFKWCFNGTFNPPNSITYRLLPLSCFSHHIQHLSLLMMCWQCWRSCFQGARAFSHLHLGPRHLLIPGHPLHPVPNLLTSPLLTLSGWIPSGFNWLISIKRVEAPKPTGDRKWSLLQLVIAASFSDSETLSSSPYIESMPHLTLMLPHFSQIFPFITQPSLSLSISLRSPHLPSPYPFLPPLLNRSLRQWLSQTRPPSWDQEEANAFLMRPRPQCDTLKW